ncbi:dipicolinate synthase subunit DpsA [Paenibacillus typhae]|uniref:dipicolinate synthase subunit DpsA n=1 Tax=Paenibacillus typhae TaxID=1174501 RepID=UPI001C8D7CA2|nr:dipicolinate synthase subunit DpsA [Paenibacillus typhae]MBY0012817.1 dipicolinate synthase subunit DpsA [Paenibacillus typhae]
MLSDKKIIVIGGDGRQKEVIRILTEQHANLILVGFDTFYTYDHSHNTIRSKLSSPIFDRTDAVILPVTGTNNEGLIESSYTSESLVLLEEHIQGVPDSCKIFTGTATEYLKSLCYKHHIELVELLSKDEIAIYNSISTAEGAIMLAIQNTEITIHNSVCMVLGFGRIGITLANKLKNLGAKVKIGVGESSLFARAWEMGLEPFYLSDIFTQVSNADVIFNTIEYKYLTEPIISNLKTDTLIIDLASKPGGTDFIFAEKVGIKALLASGLPGMIAPKTSGQIIAHGILKELSPGKDRSL